jgi:hypothetical protein
MQPQQLPRDGMFADWHYTKLNDVEFWHSPLLSPDALGALLDSPRDQPLGGRNVVSRLSIAGLDCCLKDFGFRPLQAQIYRIRSSKAVRAAHAADKLQHIGIDSPEPLAVIEQGSSLSLKRVQLITKFWPHDWSLRDLFTTSPEIWQPHISAVGNMMATMHKNGLVHRDNTAGNTIIRREGPNKDGARYAVIDINRLRPATLNDREICANLARIGFRDDQLRCLLDSYRPDTNPSWQGWAFETTTAFHDRYLIKVKAKKARRAKRRAAQQ